MEEETENSTELRFNNCAFPLALMSFCITFSINQNLFEINKYFCLMKKVSEIPEISVLLLGIGTEKLTDIKYSSIEMLLIDLLRFY